MAPELQWQLRMKLAVWTGCAITWVCSVVALGAHGWNDAQAKTAAASTAAAAPPVSWDSRYTLVEASGGDLCPRSPGPMVVAGGKFWVPYKIDDQAVGRIDVTVQPDGVAAAKATFDLRRVSKRHAAKLAEAPEVSVAFSRVNGTPHVELAIAGKKWRAMFGCKMVWTGAAPVQVTAPAPVSAPSRTQPVPRAAPRDDDARAREREEQRESERRAREERDQQQKEDREGSCRTRCLSTAQTCDERCEEDDDSATARCSQASGRCEEQNPDDHSQCTSDWSRCVSEATSTRNYTCEPRCKQDESSCLSGCSR